MVRESSRRSSRSCGPTKPSLTSCAASDAARRTTATRGSRGRISAEYGSRDATMSSERLRTVLICHHDAPIHYDGLARWMASWSDLVGIVILEEKRGLLWRRLKREAR